MTALCIHDLDGNDLFADPDAENLADLLARAGAAGADLSRADLRNLDLSNLDAGGLRLSGADLSGANLTGARLADCDLHGVNLTRACLRGAALHACDLSKSRLGEADLSRSRITASWMSGANAWEADFTGATMIDVSAVGAQLGQIKGAGATIENLDLHGGKIGGADLSEATVNLSDFSACHISASLFTNAHVARTRFDNSDLRSTVWDGAAVLHSSFTNSVFHDGRMRGARLTETNFENADTRSARFVTNSYRDIQGRTAEMRADNLAHRTTEGVSKAAAYALTGGVGVYAFMNAPESVTSLAENHLVGAGAVGLLATVAARGVVGWGAGWINRNVIPRIAGVMARTAPQVSAAATRIPAATFMHRMRDMRFTFVSGLSERRVQKMIDAANRKDRKPDDPVRAAGGLFGRDVHLVVTRDEAALRQIEEMAAKGDRPVVAVRLTAEGKPRENGPALYQFMPDGSQSVVWFNRGRPDVGAVFDRDGKPLARRHFRGRREMIRNGESLPTKILSRGDTSQRQANSWLSTAGAEPTVRGTGTRTALTLREAGGYLDMAAKMMPRGAEEARRQAQGVAAALSRIGSEKGDHTPPALHRNQMQRAREATEAAVDLMEQQGLSAFARLGARLGRRLAQTERMVRAAPSPDSDAAGSDRAVPQPAGVPSSRSEGAPAPAAGAANPHARKRPRDLRQAPET